jgi:hypothetical protein
MGNMHMQMSTNAAEKKRTNSYPRDAMTQAEIVIRGWSQVGERLFVPNLDLVSLQKKLQEAKKRVERAEVKKEERAGAVHERNLCLSELWDLTKRVRNSAKATFGDYSPELDILQRGDSACQEDNT